MVQQTLAQQVVQASTTVAQDVAEATVVTRAASVGLVTMAVEFSVVVIVGLALMVEMVAVAVALLGADHGVAGTSMYKFYSPSV